MTKDAGALPSLRDNLLYEVVCRTADVGKMGVLVK